MIWELNPCNTGFLDLEHASSGAADSVHRHDKATSRHKLGPVSISLKGEAEGSSFLASLAASSRETASRACTHSTASGVQRSVALCMQTCWARLQDATRVNV